MKKKTDFTNFEKKYTHCRSLSTPSTLKSDKIFFEIKTCALMTSEKIENPRLDWAENYFRKFIFVYINVAYWKYKNVKLRKLLENQTSALEFWNLFKFFFFQNKSFVSIQIYARLAIDKNQKDFSINKCIIKYASCSWKQLSWNSRKSSKFWAQKFNDNFLITGVIVKAD